MEIQPRMYTNIQFDSVESSDLNLEWKGKTERKTSWLCHGSNTEPGHEMTERQDQRPTMSWRFQYYQSETIREEGSSKLKSDPCK